MEKSILKALEDAGLSEREVTPFMRVRVVGLTRKLCHGKDSSKEGLITIWNPSEKQVNPTVLLYRSPFCWSLSLLPHVCLWNIMTSLLPWTIILWMLQWYLWTLPSLPSDTAEDRAGWGTCISCFWTYTNKFWCGYSTLASERIHNNMAAFISAGSRTLQVSIMFLIFLYFLYLC